MYQGPFDGLQASTSTRHGILLLDLLKRVASWLPICFGPQCEKYLREARLEVGNITSGRQTQIKRRLKRLSQAWIVAMIFNSRLLQAVGGGGTWGSLFELGDVHVTSHVTVHRPSCRYLQGRSSSIASSSWSHSYVSRQPSP